MYRFVAILFIFNALFLTSVNAQENSWATDSLAIYTAWVKKAIKQKDIEQAKKLNKQIGVEASKTLEAVYFKYFNDLLENTKIKANPELKATVYNHLGNLEFYRSNYSGAKLAFKKALILYTKVGLDINAAGMAMNLGILMEKSQAYDSAIMSYEKAMVIFKELGDTSAVANCFENLALSYKKKGDFDLAVIYIEKADSVLQTNTPLDAARWIYLYYNKRFIFLAMSNYDEALKFAFKGLILSEKLDNERFINNGYSYIADVYHMMKDTTNWQKYVHRGRAFSEKTGNQIDLRVSDYNLAYFHLAKDNYDSASYYADMGLARSMKFDDKSGLTNGNLLKGNIAYKLKAFDEAIKYFEITLDQLADEENGFLAGVYHNLGSAYMEVGNFEGSNQYLLKSLVLRKEFNEKGDLKESYESLATNSQKQGNFKDAYTYYVKFRQYEDTIFNEIKARQIAEVQTEYETAKKDQAIASLEQDNEIKTLKAQRQQSQLYFVLVGLALVLIIAFVFYYRSRLKHKANIMLAAKNNEIEKQDKEKEMLLKEIHHRVKNNLQIISSLLSMQTRTLSDSKMIDAMKESQSRVKTMALIHEKLYQYDNLARINMNDYLNQLSDFLSQTYRSEKEIKVIIESEEINLDIDTAVPLGLITNELLSNALKYAFEDVERGEIKIKLSKDAQGAYSLTISDTGKGLAEDMDIEKSKSLGLKLVRTLTRQINGSLSITTQPGATFSIMFVENPLAA